MYTAFGALQLALIALWAKSTAVRTRASIPNSVLGLLTAIVLLILSIIEHSRSARPALVIESYLSVSILFDAARVRTLWLQEYNKPVAVVTTLLLVNKILLLCVEAIGKGRLLRPEWRSGSPEATSGLFGKSFFLWLNPLFWVGFSRSLSIDDLLPLDKHLTSGYLYQRLHGGFIPNVPRSLLKTFFRRLLWHLLWVVPPRLGLIAFNFCQPFLVQRAIDLSQQPINNTSTNAGYGLIGAYFLVYTGIAVTTGQYQHLTYRSITMARGGLISMLFVKSTSLEANAVDSAQALTLMSADIERITNGWQTMHEIWANIIEVALAIYLLERQLGAACAIPLAVAICKFEALSGNVNVSSLLTFPLRIGSFLGSVFIMNMVAQRQALWLEAIERRISATTSMLGSMKRVKMCGLTETLFDNVHNLRIQELQISKGFRRLLIGSLFFAFTTPVIAPVLTFIVFSLVALRSGGKSTLDTSKAFTSLSLFALLADPLASLIMALTAFAGSLGSFDRIQTFLETTEHEDKRLQGYPANVVDTQSSQTSETSDESLPSTEKSSILLLSEKNTLSFSNAVGDALSVQEGSFGWDSEKKPLISSIQLKIPRGKLTMIVGPVGCGKSTLLKALLGEVPAISGKINLFAGDSSYCDQSPFHMNGTVRDSVTAFSKFDDRWYRTVFEACALDDDLRQMHLADQTRIGSKGIALSGGQSQRLALARAVYARRDMCFLDDVLSGLDLDTENRVFHNLLGLDGLLRRQSATIVLASSSSKRLPFADHIVVLDKDGTIAEQGSYKELIASGGYVSSLDLAPAEWTSLPKESNLDLLMSNTSKLDHSDLLPKESMQTKDDPDFEANKRTGDLSIYAYYIRSVGWFAVVTFIVAISAYVFSISFPQIWLGWWATANATAPNASLGYWLGIYALLAVLGLISLVISCWQIIITMVPRSGQNFHHRLLKTVLDAPLSFFSTTDTGVTLNRFSQDLQLIDMDLPIAALNFFTASVLCIAQIILIGVSSTYAAASFPIWFIALYLIQKFYLRTSRQLRFLDLEAKSPLYSQFSEVIAGLITVRAFGWQSALEKRNRFLLDQSQRPFYLLFAVQRWLQLVLDLLVTGVAVLLIVLVVELRGIISGVYVGIALLNVILFSQNLKLVLQFWTMLETHIGAVSRIKNFTASTTAESSPPVGKSLPPSWPANGNIEFRSVFAGYDPSRMVLKDLNLSIQAGEKIGICGRTGSGKSSLILAIFGMIDLHGGSIIVDGVDLSTIPRQEARSRIIGLPQDVLLLKGTVRLNVDPYKRASDKAIIGALEDVRLWEGIQEKGGLDAEIDAVNLSHGQKQLLCVAQALLRPSSILILDEATSRYLHLISSLPFISFSCT